MTHEINNGKGEIRCPETNCKKGKLSGKEVKTMVDEQLYLKYLALTEDKAVFLSKKLKWCPAPNCKTICKVESKSSASKTTCPKCQTEFCSKCSENWTEHPTECNPTTADVKPCPGCQAPIQRQDGCFKVQCTFCKTDFCWDCLKKVGGYLHFRCNGRLVPLWETTMLFAFVVTFIPILILMGIFVAPLYLLAAVPLIVVLACFPF